MANDHLVRDEIILNDTSNPTSKPGYDDVDSVLAEPADGLIKQYYNKQRKFSEAQIQEMKESINEVCLNDFSDDYHLSTEERFANAEEARIFAAMSKTKRKCNNIVDFVIAMRYRLDAINYIAENNGVYEPDKFRKLVAKGKIFLPGIPIPKYTGKDRKHINWDYIFEFIADGDRDPSDLKDHSDTGFYEHARENHSRNIFSNEQYRILVEQEYTDDDAVEVEFILPSSKTMKRLVQDNPDVQYAALDYVSDIKKRIGTSYAYDTFSAREEFESIQVLDQRNIRNSNVRPPDFVGSVSSDKDMDEFLRNYHDWYVENTYVSRNGKSMSIRDADLENLKNVMEDEGINVKKLAVFTKYCKTVKKLKKKENKRLSNIKGKIKDGQSRGKKRKKKKGKKKKDTEKFLNEIKRQQERDLLELTGGNYADFEDYENEMSSANYDDIMSKYKE